MFKVNGVDIYFGLLIVLPRVTKGGAMACNKSKFVDINAGRSADH